MLMMLAMLCALGMLPGFWMPMNNVSARSPADAHDAGHVGRLDWKNVGQLMLMMLAQVVQLRQTWAS